MTDLTINLLHNCVYFATQAKPSLVPGKLRVENANDAVSITLDRRVFPWLDVDDNCMVTVLITKAALVELPADPTGPKLIARSN